MIWVDREVKKIKERHLPLEWVDDMKTPSGRIHVGSLRGVVIHDLMYKALAEQGVKAHFSYVFNNMDPMDGLPTYLDKNKWEKYMGSPLYRIPSPEPGFDNFAQYFANEFIQVFNSINCHPQIIWSIDLYRSGKMNVLIKLVLDNADKVREIYKKVAKTEKPADWFPYSPICEKCGKIGTTRVYKWDGRYVYYRCEKAMVEWAQGCGYEGKVEPINDNGKLPWKLDWPAHWKTIGVTIESSGKDHMSAGGSYDLSSHICREILNYEAPDALGGYEWFTIGGRKMSSSKGIGTSAKETSSILPPDVFRFLLVRTPKDTHLDFNPEGETIPNLFDDYDRCLNAYFAKLENNIPKSKQGEVMLDFARIAELSAVQPMPLTRMLLPRFRTIVNLLKNKADIADYFMKQKKAALTIKEKEMLDERIKYANLYLRNYAIEKTTTNEPFVLFPDQKQFLETLKDYLNNLKSNDRNSIQESVFTALKTSGLKPKVAFQAFYRQLVGQNAGPKAADLILDLGVENVIEKLSGKQQSMSARRDNKTSHLPDLNDPQIFSIGPAVAEKYPSITIGIAVIKNVKINKNNAELSKKFDEFIHSQENLTTEILGTYPEVKSYRQLYKEMGVDWHSRRPSPEALLRRVAQKKNLYRINDCVDAYNLVVMKNRISVGAFDLDKIKFPTILKFPQEGDEILLHGDNEPTKYKPMELAYCDQTGGYNIDFNYRDAQRSLVTDETKDLLINVDGIYEISRQMVEKTLQESVDEIVKYCGGQQEIAGIVSVQ